MTDDASIARNDQRPSLAPARVLGTLDTSCIVIGAIIGVGIFFTPSSIARLVDTAPLALLAWGIAGVIALCGALAFAELGGLYHASGAQYQILRDCYGPLPAFLFVFCNATAIQAGVIGIIALVCAQNIGAAVSDTPLSAAALMTLSLALIIGLAGANIIGVRWGSRIQNLTVYAKVFTLLAVTIMAMFAARAHPIFGEVHSLAEDHTLTAVQGVLAALVPALFAYGGWQQALWISGEVRDPQRTLPRAIIGGVLLVIIVYLLANWAYLRLLGAHGVAQSQALAADAVAVIMPGAGRRLIAVAVAISAFGVLNAQLLAGPRLIYGMARDGRFFQPFAQLHPRLGTPIASIVLLTGMAIVLLLIAGQDGVDKLLTGAVLIDGLFFILTGAALFVLRTRRPDQARPFRVPGYPLIPALFVIGELGVVAGSFLDPKVRSAALIGVAWIIAAAVVYAIWFRSGRRA